MSNLQRRMCDLPRRATSARRPVPNSHPLVAQLFSLIGDRSFHHVAERAGMARELLYYWAGKGKSPTLLKFNDVLNALGYELKIVRKESP